MLELVTAGALAGILSAPHCALMCGPVGVYAGRLTPSGLTRYQIGRFASYLLAGVAMGAAGKPILGLLWNSAAVFALSWALAAVMLYAAYQHWPRTSKANSSEKLLTIKQSKKTLIAKVLSRLPKRPEILGAMSLLLPCAALWSGLVLAASSGGALSGGLVMGLFALTSGLGFLASGIIARLLRNKPARNRTFSVFLVLAAAFFVLRPFGMAKSDHTSGSDPAVEHCPLHSGMGL